MQKKTLYKVSNAVTASTGIVQELLFKLINIYYSYHQVDLIFRIAKC